MVEPKNETFFGRIYSKIILGCIRFSGTPRFVASL
jgi:hypothetical protein